MVLPLLSERRHLSRARITSAYRGRVVCAAGDTCAQHSKTASSISLATSRGKSPSSNTSLGTFTYLRRTFARRVIDCCRVSSETGFPAIGDAGQFRGDPPLGEA